MRPLDVSDLRCARCGEPLLTPEDLGDPEIVDRIARQASRGWTHMCLACTKTIWQCVARLPGPAKGTHP